MIWKGHPDRPRGQVHAQMFGHNCGRINCVACHARAARREYRRLDKIMIRAHGLVERTEGPVELRRYIIVPKIRWLDHASVEPDWWSTRILFTRIRAILQRELASALPNGAWVLIFHGGDDRPEFGCPWAGHFHVAVFAKGNLNPLQQLGWTVRSDRAEQDWPVWCQYTLSSLSSWPSAPASLLRVSYGGLASPVRQRRAGLPRLTMKSAGFYCGVCDHEVPKDQWFRAEPPPGFDPGPHDCFIVDPRKWTFYSYEEVGWGPPMLRPIDLEAIA